MNNKLIQEVKSRFDKVLDVYVNGTYTEISGYMGGDIITLRIYDDGTVTER